MDIMYVKTWYMSQSNVGAYFIVNICKQLCGFGIQVWSHSGTLYATNCHGDQDVGYVTWCNNQQIDLMTCVSRPVKF